MPEIQLPNGTCCPCCLSPLTQNNDNKLNCTNIECGSVFPVVKNIPILINEDKSIFSISNFVKSQNSETQTGLKRQVATTLMKITPAIGNNLKDDEICQRFAERLIKFTERPKILVVGCGQGGGGMETLENFDQIELTETDVSFGQRTNIICDGHSLPFADSSFDGVVIQAVLEHVADPYQCVAEIYRVLKPKGLVYAETPFIQQVHGRQYDFTRFTHLGHRRLFRQFEEIESGASCGPGMALAWSYKYFLLSFVKSKTIRFAVSTFASFTSFFLKYFDRMNINKPGALDAASSYFFVGEKSEKTLTDRELITLYRGGF